MAIVLRIFQNSKGNRYAIILGNYLICILISWFSLPNRSMVLGGSPATILCGIIGGAFFVAGLVTMQTSTRLNGATLTSVFAKMGLVISLAISIFVFGEKPTPMQIAGVVLILAALVMINGPADEKTENALQTGKVYTGALILTMLANGGGSSMSKIFEQVGTRDQDELYFFYLFFTAAVLTAVLLLLEWKCADSRPSAPGVEEDRKSPEVERNGGRHCRRNSQLLCFLPPAAGPCSSPGDHCISDQQHRIDPDRYGC